MEENDLMSMVDSGCKFVSVSDRRDHNNVLGLTQDQLSLWNILNTYMPLKINDLEPVDYGIRTLSFDSLGLFRGSNFSFNFDGQEVFVMISDLGLSEASLNNLSIRGQTLVTVSGSGARVLQEIWEKHDGDPLITITLIDIHKNPVVSYGFFFERALGWAVGIVPQHLYYSGEVKVGEKQDTLFVQEAVVLPYSIKFLSREGFATFNVEVNERLAPCIKNLERIRGMAEGVVVLIDFVTYRVKKQPTIDLKVVDGDAYTEDGQIIFHDVQGAGICEFTLEGIFVRKRNDKGKADSKYKWQLVSAAPTVKQLCDLIKLSGVFEQEYTPAMFLGTEAILEEIELEYHPAKEDEKHQLVEIVSKNKYKQPYNVTLEKVEEPDLNVMIKSAKDGFINHTRTMNSYLRGGIGITGFHWKRFLAENGITLDYSRFRVYYRKNYDSYCDYLIEHSGFVSSTFVNPYYPIKSPRSFKAIQVCDIKLDRVTLGKDYDLTFKLDSTIFPGYFEFYVPRIEDDVRMTDRLMHLTFFARFFCIWTLQDCIWIVRKRRPYQVKEYERSPEERWQCKVIGYYANQTECSQQELDFDRYYEYLNYHFPDMGDPRYLTARGFLDIVSVVFRQKRMLSPPKIAL